MAESHGVVVCSLVQIIDPPLRLHVPELSPAEVLNIDVFEHVLSVPEKVNNP